MTRINSNIPPEELHTVHLLAEHREILRVIDVAKKAQDRGYIPQGYGIPETFCLGNGHVKFFANKLEFVVLRYERIFNECMNRNLKVTKFRPSVKTLSDLWEWYNNWESTEQDDDLVRERILERVAANRKKYNFPDDVEINQETWADHVKKDREQRIRGEDVKPTILSYTQRAGSRVIDINNLHDFYAYIYASRIEYKNGILHLQDIQGEPDEVARSIDGFIYEKLENGQITERTCHMNGKQIDMTRMKELEQFYF